MPENKTRIDFRHMLVDVYGKRVKTEDRTQQPIKVLENGMKIYPEIEMPLHFACTQALLYGPGPDGKERPSKELGRKRYIVAAKVAKAEQEGHSGIVSLKPDEVVMIVEAVDVFYGPVVSGPVHALLGASDDDEAVAKAYAGIGKPEETSPESQ